MIQALSSTPSGVLMVRNSGRGRLSPATFAVRDPLSASVRTTLPSARRRACTGGTPARALRRADGKVVRTRSEEHTSELQSRQYLVCRLLLEKKKKNTKSLSNS